MQPTVLDVQLAKKDELVFISSGLDTLQAFMLITGHVYTAFENYMLMTITKSGGAISFTTASEIATRLATGFIAPLASQLDPHRLGEIDRMMAIATAYGERLERGNLHDGALDRLVNDYPAHSFIIDMEEAKTLFKHVTFMTGDEIVLTAAVNQALGGCIYEPSDDILIYDVRLIGSDEAQEESPHDKTSATPGNASVDSSEPKTVEAAPRKRPKSTKANGPDTPKGSMRTGHQDPGIPTG